MCSGEKSPLRISALAFAKALSNGVGICVLAMFNVSSLSSVTGSTCGVLKPDTEVTDDDTTGEPTEDVTGEPKTSLDVPTTCMDIESFVCDKSKHAWSALVSAIWRGFVLVR